MNGLASSQAMCETCDRPSSLSGRKVLVMGLGRFGGGVDAARYAVQVGAKVVVTDKAREDQLQDSIKQLADLSGIEYRLGGHDPQDFATADVVIANPAIPLDNEFLQLARRSGRTVTSQIGLFFQACPARIIGITGANGKSTTTTLTAHLLEHARPKRPAGRGSRAVERSHPPEEGASYAPYKKVWLSGNIGDKPLLTILDKVQADDLVVLEISSFQVEQLGEVCRAPHVSLLTNLTPNHLDRYGTFEAYCAAKEGLFNLQTLDEKAPAVSIFNAEDPIACSWHEKYRSQAGRVCLTFSADDVSDKMRSEYALPGRANLSNLAAAMAIAKCFGVSERSIRSCLPSFKALPHRLELVAEGHGVRWYDDSKATTPEGAMVALSAFDCPKVLIAGGYDKHTPFTVLGEAIASSAKAVVLIGQTARMIADAVHAAPQGGREIDVQFAGSLAEAVEIAGRLAAPGNVVLLSPACASYDMFENYQQRGRLFGELARQAAVRS
ncbi:MAG: UDP-N-acetylmuramoyl-L-alanine--D-glutamate ligase [Phycisphaerae bacterium]|nr:UDP-N-acetylmuramoyl-L-alanine--D-glutamate ligase [Phycisphaerae bacterium]